MRISGWMTLGLIGMMPAYAILVGLTGGNGIANSETILLVILLCVILTLTLHTTQNSTRALLVTLGLAIGIRFLQRLIIITSYPEVTDFTFRFHPSAYEMNRSLLFLILGIIAISLGFVVGRAIHRRPSKNVGAIASNTDRPRQNKNSLYAIRKLIYLISFLFLIIHFFLRFAAQEGISGIPSGPLGWLTQLLPSTGFLMLNILLFERYRHRLQTVDRVAILAYVASFFIMLTFQGVRGAAVSIVLLWVTVLIALKGDPRILVKHVAAMSIVAVILLVFLFDFAFAIRTQWTSDGNLDLGNLIPTYEASRGRHDIFWVSESNNGFDRLMVVMNHHWVDPGIFLNTPNMLKSSIGNFVPDALWEHNAIQSVRAFPALYRFSKPRTAAIALQGIHGEYWTIFAWMYGYLGYFGGLAGMFLFGAISSYAFSRLWEKTSDLWLFAKAWLLSMIYSCVASGNIDVIVSTQIVSLLAISALLLCLRWSATTNTMLPNRHAIAPNAK